MTDKEMQALIEQATKERAAGYTPADIIHRHTGSYLRWAKDVKKKVYRSVATVAVVLFLFAVGLHTIPLHTGTTGHTAQYAVADIAQQNIYANVTTFCNISCSQREVINIITSLKC